MTIRKLFAATAVAGAFVLAAGSGAAFADDARTEGNVAPGQQVCVSLPATADPVRAEGLGDPGVFFTLSSEGVVLASGPERLAATVNGVPGVAQLCAANQTGADAYANLYLTSGPAVTDAPVTGTVESSVPADEPPATDMSVPADDTAPVPADVQNLIDEIQRLVDEIIEQVLAAL